MASIETMRRFSRILLLAPVRSGAHGLRGGHSWRLPAALLAALAFACAPDSPEGGVPTHPSDRFSVTLAWDAPATDAMGNALVDLAGYRIYHSPSMPPDGPQGTLIEVGDSTECAVGNLEAGVYYFAVTALDEAGNESDLSEALRVEVGGP